MSRPEVSTTFPRLQSHSLEDPPAKGEHRDPQLAFRPGWERSGERLMAMGAAVPALNSAELHELITSLCFLFAGT